MDPLKCFTSLHKILWIALMLYNCNVTPCSAQPTNVMTFDNMRSVCEKNEICVKKELCVNGTVDSSGIFIISKRQGDVECDKVHDVCCKSSSEDFHDDPEWTGECGQRDVRGMDTGSDTKRAEFPWSVAVFAHMNVLGTLRYMFLCGGTLIYEPVVITTAACVLHKNVSELFVHVGLLDVDASSDRFTQIIQVEKVEKHKDYHHSSHINNIALLVLKNSVRFGRSVNRVCLPEGDQKFETNSTCYIVGWEDQSFGDSNALLKLTAEHANRDECSKYIRFIGGNPNYILPKEHLCADFTSSLVPCARVQGSGMVCTLNNNSEQFFLVGIATYSLRHCSQPPAYDVFQTTENYISWVDNHMRNLSRDVSYYRPVGSNEEDDKNDEEVTSS